MDYSAGCIVHCNKVTKPVMHVVMHEKHYVLYFLLTPYTLIMFFKKF